MENVSVGEAKIRFSELISRATGLAHNATLFTHSRRHFERVPHVIIEDWLL
jgi:predicted nucleic acid-binding protein